MLQRLVGPAAIAGLLLVLTGCVAPSARPPQPPAAASATAEPGNLYTLKQQIKAYVDSGRYDADLAAVAAEAQRWIETRPARAGEKAAVVFDLDETLLCNLEHMRAMDFGYVHQPWEDWVNEGRAPVIAPVREAYRAARARGFAVFFITGRRQGNQPGTEKNLRELGLGGYTRIFYKPADYRGTTESFKTATRRALVETEGYTIIANIGDQASDLAGGYAERGFKLPNPFYLAQ